MAQSIPELLHGNLDAELKIDENACRPEPFFQSASSDNLPRLLQQARQHRRNPVGPKGNGPCLGQVAAGFGRRRQCR